MSFLPSSFRDMGPIPTVIGLSRSGVFAYVGSSLGQREGNSPPKGQKDRISGTGISGFSEGRALHVRKSHAPPICV